MGPKPAIVEPAYTSATAGLPDLSSRSWPLKTVPGETVGAGAAIRMVLPGNSI